MKRRVADYIGKYHMIAPGDTVFVGLSGGADSVCLLRLLLELRQELGITLEAIHVHHGMREAADGDVSFVKKLCDELGVPLTIRYVDAPAYAAERKISLEEAARVLRYQAYESVCRQKSVQSDYHYHLTDASGDTLHWHIESQQKSIFATNNIKIALAHHKNDQAETVLFHLLRGTGLKGMAGMEPVRDVYIRPLLDVTRGEIEAYLAAAGWAYVTDETNADTTYTRNAIRHQLLPLCEELMPGATSGILRQAELARGAADYLETQVAEKYKSIMRCKYLCNIEAEDFYKGDETDSSRENLCNDVREEDQMSIVSRGSVASKPMPCKICVEKNALLVEHSYIQCSLIYRAITHLAGQKKDIAKVHVDSVLALLAGQSGRKVDLPYGISVLVTQQELVFMGEQVPRQSSAAQDVAAGTTPSDVVASSAADIHATTGDVAAADITICGTQPCDVAPSITTSIFPYDAAASIPDATYTKWFDYDKIKRPLTLRHRQSGDYFYLDEDHRKKLKQFFIDEKIPLDKREDIWVLAEANSNHVIWVIGHRISAAYKVTEDTEMVYQVEIDFLHP